MMDEVVWKIKTFSQLSVDELYSILKIRQEVFIVEQTCYYLDADGYDKNAVHVWAEHHGDIAAYSRIFGPGIKYEEASIGRVLTHPEFRKANLGKTLMRISLATIEARFHTDQVRISAQMYLRRFYESFGFEICGESYLEDDIPHIEMLRSEQSTSTNLKDLNAQIFLWVKSLNADSSTP